MIPRRLVLLLDEFETGAGLLLPPPTPFYGYFPPVVALSKNNILTLSKDNRTSQFKNSITEVGKNNLIYIGKDNGTGTVQ